MHFFCILLVSTLQADRCASSSILSGDKNPPGYTVMDVDVDTIDGQVAVRPSIIGYVNSLEGITILQVVQSL